VKRLWPAVLVALMACAPAPELLDDGGASLATPFAVAIDRFDPGAGAGHGADKLPCVVLGPPSGGKEATAGNVDGVLSLGHQGEIVLELGVDVVDGEGPDLIVFENPFLYPGGVWAEPGEVAVSLDGERFDAFPCAPSEPAPNGCAGYGLVYAGSDPTNPEEAGGDAFDLADIRVERARYVRIRDRGPRVTGDFGTAGFDLDAVAVVNAAAVD
jgi:hypothetical protein